MKKKGFILILIVSIFSLILLASSLFFNTKIIDIFCYIYIVFIVSFCIIIKLYEKRIEKKVLKKIHNKEFDELKEYLWVLEKKKLIYATKQSVYFYEVSNFLYLDDIDSALKKLEKINFVAYEFYKLFFKYTLLYFKNETELRKKTYKNIISLKNKTKMKYKTEFNIVNELENNKLSNESIMRLKKSEYNYLKKIARRFI